MVDVELLRSAGEADPEEWSLLTCDRGLDSGQPYLLFREYLEPGIPFVLAAWHGGHLAGALHGVLTTARTAFFTHPWKMLTDDRMLRGENPAQLTELRRNRDSLIRAVTSDGAGWEELSGSVGEVITIRGFDHSNLLLRTPMEMPQRERVCAALLSAARQAVYDGLAGAIAFPFVDPADAVLRQSLVTAGFQCGIVTGASVFNLAGFASYNEYVARLPGRTRSRYRREVKEFEASGLRIETIPIRDNVARITDLEAQTVARHGGHPDPRQMLASRQFLSDVLPENIRVPGITRDGDLIACGIELIDTNNCYAASYGCDYTQGMGSIGYHNICFYNPLSYCCDNGVKRLHMGFEAFMPKKIRGAIVQPLEMWLWTPGMAKCEGLAALLRFIDSRASCYLRQFTGPAIEGLRSAELFANCRFSGHSCYSEP